MKLKIKEKDYNELLQYKEKYEEQLYRANGLSYLCDNYLVEINKFDYIYDFDTNEQDSIKLDFRTNYNDKIIQI